MCAISGIREEKRDVGDGKDKRKMRKEKSGFQWSFTNGERMMKSVLFLLFGKGRWYTDTKHYFLDNMTKYFKCVKI